MSSSQMQPSGRSCSTAIQQRQRSRRVSRSDIQRSKRERNRVDVSATGPASARHCQRRSARARASSGEAGRIIMCDPGAARLATGGTTDTTGLLAAAERCIEPAYTSRRWMAGKHAARTLPATAAGRPMRGIGSAGTANRGIHAGERACRGRRAGEDRIGLGRRTGESHGTLDLGASEVPRVGGRSHHPRAARDRPRRAWGRAAGDGHWLQGRDDPQISSGTASGASPSSTLRVRSSRRPTPCTHSGWRES